MLGGRTPEPTAGRVLALSPDHPPSLSGVHLSPLPGVCGAPPVAVLPLLLLGVTDPTASAGGRWDCCARPPAASPPSCPQLRSPCVAVMLAVLSVGCSRSPLARLLDAEWTCTPWWWPPWWDLVGVDRPNLDGVGGDCAWPWPAAPACDWARSGRCPDRRDGERPGAARSGDGGSPAAPPPAPSLLSPWNAGKRGSGSSTPPLPGVRLTIVAAVSGVDPFPADLPARGVVCPPAAADGGVGFGADDFDGAGLPPPPDDDDFLLPDDDDALVFFPAVLPAVLPAAWPFFFVRRFHSDLDFRLVDGPPDDGCDTPGAAIFFKSNSLPSPSLALEMGTPPRPRFAYPAGFSPSLSRS
mmetsp:Transcript_16155/g.36190  ORF Transcript_16155/g.36190 Transcript_16155/m.36190 type:complete len:354 (+) Transcript_16155:466-1527(+)